MGPYMDGDNIHWTRTQEEKQIWSLEGTGGFQYGEW